MPATRPPPPCHATDVLTPFTATKKEVTPLHRAKDEKAVVRERMRDSRGGRRGSVAASLAVEAARAAAMMADLAKKRKPVSYANDRVFERLATSPTKRSKRRPSDFRRFFGLIVRADDKTPAGAIPEETAAPASPQASPVASRPASDSPMAGRTPLRVYELGSTAHISTFNASPTRRGTQFLGTHGRRRGSLDSDTVRDPRQGAYRNPDRRSAASTLGVRLGREAAPQTDVMFRIGHSQHKGPPLEAYERRARQRSQGGPKNWFGSAGLQQESPVRSYR